MKRIDVPLQMYSILMSLSFLFCLEPRVCEWKGKRKALTHTLHVWSLWVQPLRQTKQYVNERLCLRVAFSL